MPERGGSRLEALAAREELVPGAEQRLGPVDGQREALAGRDHVPQGVPGEQPDHLGGQPGGQANLGRVALVAQVGGGTSEELYSSFLRAESTGEGLGGALHEARALLQHQLDVDARLDLDRRVVPPGAVGVAPGLDREGPFAGPGGSDGGAPPIRAGGEGVHRDVVPGLAPRVPEHHVRVDRVVPLAEHRGLHLEGLTGDGLRRSRSAVHHRMDVRDRYAGTHVFERTRPEWIATRRVPRQGEPPKWPPSAFISRNTPGH